MGTRLVQTSLLPSNIAQPKQHLNKFISWVSSIHPHVRGPLSNTSKNYRCRSTLCGPAIHPHMCGCSNNHRNNADDSHYTQKERVSSCNKVHTPHHHLHHHPPESSTRRDSRSVLSRCTDCRSISPTQGAKHRVRTPNPRSHTTCVDCSLSVQSNNNRITTIPHRKGIAHNNTTTTYKTVPYLLGCSVQ